MDWETLKSVWWLLGAAGGLLIYSARAGWKSRRLLERMDRLERHDEARRRDISALLEGMFAVLDGLKQQGCNGEVTRAYMTLKQYVVQKR